MLIENCINIDFCFGIIDVDFIRENLFLVIERLFDKKISFFESCYVVKLIGNEWGYYFDIGEDVFVLYLE